MKRIFLFFFGISAYVGIAQSNSGSISIPNSGVNTTPAPTNTQPQNNNLSNPTNSSTPGSNGSYSVDPAKPLSNPNTNGTYTPAPIGTPPGGNTYTPQTTGQKKK